MLKIRWNNTALAVDSDGGGALLTLLSGAGLELNGGCGGNGICCHCAVELLQGTFRVGSDVLTVDSGDRIPALACLIDVCCSEAEIEIPASSSFVFRKG